VSEDLEAALAAIPLVRRVVLHDETGSTNDDARRLAQEGAPDGTVVVARSQRAGRGRLGRAWHSPGGTGLYLSILLRPAGPLERVGRYALVAGIATVEACRAAGAAGARIKWPNDVVVDGRKLAGILAELRSGADTAELVLGFGVNLRTPEGGFPADIATTATSLAAASGGAGVDLAGTAVVLARALDLWIGRLRAGDWDEVRNAFVRYAPGVEGSAVTLHGGVTGVTAGLDDSGALRVATTEGVLLVHGGESVAAWGS
jgi:BirA family transcriptional regulator, biotin operon repressor / biotin---[acetyl-CoA-carboxylase] ligase